MSDNNIYTHEFYTNAEKVSESAEVINHEGGTLERMQAEIEKLRDLVGDLSALLIHHVIITLEEIQNR